MKKTVKEQILDWFERNSSAKVRSGPLAKALKIAPAQVADALGKMAEAGELMRIRVAVAAADREVNSPTEQWEYWVPLSGKAPEPFKPYKPQPSVHRPSSAGIPSRATATLEPPAPRAKPPIPTAAANVPAAKPAENEESSTISNLHRELKASEAQAKAAIQRAEKAEESLALAREQESILRQQLEAAQKAQDDQAVDSAAKLAEAHARIAALEESQPLASTLETRTAAGYVVVAPAKPIQRFNKQGNAQGAALSAAGSGKRAEVFALYPVGKAVPGAQWRPAK